MATAFHPSELPEITSPIRDESALGPNEDLDREPDGVPHDVVGLTALFAVMLAVLCGVIFVTGAMGHVTAAVLALLAVPKIVMSLTRRAARERDPRHPAR